MRCYNTHDCFWKCFSDSDVEHVLRKEPVPQRIPRICSLSASWMQVDQKAFETDFGSVALP